MRTAGAGSLRASVAASDAHAARVCSSLGDGVLAALPRLASALTPGASTRHAAATFDQALTVVYRILFLLFAEARGAVPVWHELYRDAYTIDALTRRAPATAHARGLWAALQAISRLAHAGCKAGDLESPPSTAGSSRRGMRRWSSSGACRTRWSATCCSRSPRESTPQGRRRISYHDLGVEQLGSVYERVLEYEPRSRGAAIALSRTSIERKATGSFYTPRSITEFLVRRTLSPLVEGKTADQILELRVLDPAMGSGAFLVAACQFLADHCEKALIDEGRWSRRRRERRRIAPRSDARSPNGACTASISIPRPCSSRACRCGSPRWPRIGRSRFSITISPPATACWARASPICPSRRLRARRVRSHDVAAALRRSARRDRRASSDAGAAPARAHAVGFARRRERQRTHAGGAVGGGWPDRQVVARRGPLVRRAAMARGASRLAAGVWSPNGWPPPPDRRPRCRRRNFASRCEPRARSRTATARFTGSWRFRKCSSTATGGSSPTAALMRCSATRRGTWCAPTPALRRIARRRKAGTTAALRFYRAPCLFTARPRARQPLSTVPGARVAADETGRTRRADPAVRDCDRSRQRGAAQTSARSHRDRHLARVRQPPAHLSDSPQHAVRRADHGERRPHRRVEVPLRPHRCRRAGAGRRGGAAAADDLAIAPRIVESRQSRDPGDSPMPRRSRS